MKKVLYLTKYEFRRIKKSAILTAIVLAIFLGALFGIISVQTDLMDNMCAHLDENYPEGIDIYAHYVYFDEISDFYDGPPLDTDIRLIRVTLHFAKSKTAFDAYRRLARRGVEVSLGWSYEGYYTDIVQMRAAFTAVDAVLAVVTIVALYSLVSVLFRQRKTQICRLKILGASDSLVAGVYCGTVTLLMLAVVLLATALGVAFNYYFMDLCQVMLQYSFVSHFTVYLPFVAFAVFCAVTFVLWIAVNRRTRNNLASEIRYE